MKVMRTNCAGGLTRPAGAALDGRFAAATFFKIGGPDMPCKRGASSRMAPFNAAYCEQLVEFMGRGYSLTAFAGEIGVTRATLEAWREKHPTFARAVARGQARRARVLEDHLLAAKGATAFGAHMEALKTAAPDDWRGEGAARPKPPARAALGVRLDLPDNGRDA